MISPCSADSSPCLELGTTARHDVDSDVAITMPPALCLGLPRRVTPPPAAGYPK